MTHVSSSSLSPYFYDLIDLLGVVEHRTPVMDNPEKSKRGRYFLKDNFFRFYGRFVYPVYSQYMAGNYSPMMGKVRKEWQSYTGKIFEDIVRELLVEELISDYPEISSWWNRQGDEIDILGVDHQGGKALAIEVKNKELSESEAREILELTLDKTKLVRGISDLKLKVGIVARKVKSRENLEDNGFLVWELEELIQ